MRRFMMIFVLVYGSQLPTFAGPHEEGIAAGQAANAFARATVNEANAATVVPGYTATPPEQALAGRSDLTRQVRTHIADCGQVPDDPVCDVQRGAVDSAGLPRERITATDPAIARARNITRNPSQVLGDLAGYTAGCTTAEGVSRTASANYCPGNRFCIGESCFDIAYTNDRDFVRSMTLMEAAREAGVYLDTDRMHVFSGERNRCRNRPLTNCCKTDPAGAGMTNRAVLGAGSRLVYDLLTHANNRQFVYQGMRALLEGAGFNGSFTTYGVTIAVNGTALPVGSVSLVVGDNIAIGFDPWSLAITAVMYTIVSATSCDEEEGKLAMKEGAKVCHAIGTYCSSCLRVLGRCVSCITRTTSKCCFNSVLSRLVNEQGRAQVGKQWGSAENPDCSGFTVAQLQSLDFAAMDLTEFYAAIVPETPDVARLRAAGATRVAQYVADPRQMRQVMPPRMPSPPPSVGPAPVPPEPTPGARPSPPNGNVSPYGQDPSHYRSTFAEEFGNGLNPDLWNDTIWYESPNPTKNYTVENGVLKMWPERDANDRFFNRTIDTDGKYSQTYGYFEVEAKLPLGKGTWPAFWLFNHIGDRRPEIDVMEAYAGGAPPWGFTDNNGVAHPQAYAPTVWKGDQDGQLVGSRQYDTGMDLSAGFHKYALKWEPNRQTFYFDGKEVLTLNVSMSEPMYLMLDLWFGSASGEPDASTPTGKQNAYEINYVRAWSFQ